MADERRSEEAEPRGPEVPVVLVAAFAPLAALALLVYVAVLWANAHHAGVVGAWVKSLWGGVS